MKKVESLYLTYFNEPNLFRALPFDRRRKIIAEMELIYDRRNILSSAYENFINCESFKDIFTDDEITKLLKEKRVVLARPSLTRALKDECLRIYYISKCSLSDRLALLETIQDRGLIELYLASCSTVEERSAIFQGFFSDSDIVLMMIKALQKKDVTHICDIEFLNEEKSVKAIVNYITMFNIPMDQEKTMEFMSKIRFPNLFFSFFLSREQCINMKICRYIYDNFDDDLKLSTLEKCTQPVARRVLIASLNDDDKKREYLDEFPKEKDIFSLSTNATSLDFKIELIGRLKSKSYRLHIALTAQTDLELLKMFHILSNYYYGQLSIAKKIKDDGLKYEIIKNNYFDESGRNEILSTIEDPHIRRIAATHCSKIEDRNTMYYPTVRDYVTLDAGQDALPEDLLFGIEIEAHGRKAPTVIASTDSLIGRYEVQKERDGLEFVSDKLKWTKDDLNTVYHVCDFASQNNLESNEFCGGHIHFSSDFLDSLDAWFWLFYILCRCERIFYLIANRMYTIPRAEVNSYARPISELYSDLLPYIMENAKTPAQFIETIQENTGHKTNGINLDNIFNRFNTVEFRIPNGDTDPEIILENVLLFGNLMKLAKRLSRLPMTKATYELIMTLDDDFIREEQKLDILLELMFKEEENRDIFRRRYLANVEKYYDSTDELDLESHFGEIDLKRHDIIL